MLQNIFHNNSKIMYKRGARPREERVRAPLLAAGALAGLLNGFLGAGGGMLLTLGLRASYPGQDRENMAISTAAMTVLSFLSTILYLTGGHIGSEEILPVILPALLGGALGSLLLRKIRNDLLDLFFGGLLLYSGLSLLL